MAEGTHSYFDWQVSTLMLAYDVAQPLARDDEKGQAEREQAVQRELYALVRAILPKNYLENPQTDFPPETVVMLTRGTIARAAQILGMVEEDEALPS
jgi:hypothetical protein